MGDHRLYFNNPGDNLNTGGTYPELYLVDSTMTTYAMAVLPAAWTANLLASSAGYVWFTDTSSNWYQYDGTGSSYFTIDVGDLMNGVVAAVGTGTGAGSVVGVNGAPLEMYVPDPLGTSLVITVTTVPLSIVSALLMAPGAPTSPPWIRQFQRGEAGGLDSTNSPGRLAAL